MYNHTTIQRFGSSKILIIFFKKLILLFNKDALNGLN